MAKKSSKEKIYDLLSDNPEQEFTSQQIADQIGYTKETIRRNAKKLVEEGRAYSEFQVNHSIERLHLVYSLKSKDGEVGAKTRDDFWEKLISISLSVIQRYPHMEFTTDTLAYNLSEQGVEIWMARHIGKKLAEDKRIYAEKRFVFRVENFEFDEVRRGGRKFLQLENEMADFSYYVFANSGPGNKKGLFLFKEFKNSDETKSIVLGDSLAQTKNSNQIEGNLMLNSEGEFDYDPVDLENSDYQFVYVVIFICIFGLVVFSLF